MPPTTTQLCVVAFLILLPFIIVFLIYFWNWLVYDFLLLNGLNTGDYYKNNKTYKPNTTSKSATSPIVYKTPKSTHLLPHERKCPPKAEFFGRLDGKYVESHGDYEDIYLNSFELKHWQEQKRLKGEPVPDTIAKRAKMALIDAKNEQKPELTVHWGRFGS